MRIDARLGLVQQQRRGLRHGEPISSTWSIGMSIRAATPAATLRNTCTDSGVAGTSADTAVGSSLTVATYTSRASTIPRRDPAKEGIALDLTLDRRTHGSWTVVEVGGELDLYTAPSFRESVLEAAGDHEPPKVIVDFSRLGFIDSSGLGAIACLKHLRERGGDMSSPLRKGPVSGGSSTSRAWTAC